jgi:hypothetical protein
MDTATLTTAVCALLDAAGVGVWHPTGPAYTTGQVGVFYGAIAPTPERAIGVTVYAQTDDIVTTLADRYVQVRYRGAPGAPGGADALADAGFMALHGVYHSSGIARITRVSTTPLGADGNGRQERTDNYHVLLDNQIE